MQFKMIKDIQVPNHKNSPTQWILYKIARISGQGSDYVKHD